jgi:hypothetical protein
MRADIGDSLKERMFPTVPGSRTRRTTIAQPHLMMGIRTEGLAGEAARERVGRRRLGRARRVENGVREVDRPPVGCRVAFLTHPAVAQTGSAERGRWVLGIGFATTRSGDGWDRVSRGIRATGAVTRSVGAIRVALALARCCDRYVVLVLPCRGLACDHDVVAAGGRGPPRCQRNPHRNRDDCDSGTDDSGIGRANHERDTESRLLR